MRSGRLLWLPALILALGFLAIDTGHRLHGIATLTTLRLGDTLVPSPDPASPTGFGAGQHRLILPTPGTDGYHWILQTERMLAGDGLRIRRTDVDNAPHGRDVHWSSLTRWWLGTLAWARSAWKPGMTPAQALEQVAAGAGALALALLLLAVTPFLAWRMGPGPASVFALAWVAVFPLYEMFTAGIVDHHGALAMTGFGGLILLVAGGAGWVREGGRGGEGRPPLPDEGSARRWFMAAGLVSGIGLWISAVTMIPILGAMACGGVLAAGLSTGEGRGPASGGRRDGVRPAPDLWRSWGAAGCATALAAYALEYAPGHMGMRLEVNHPFHALAWLGAGDLMARVCRALSSPEGRLRGLRAMVRGEWAAVVGALVLVGAPAVGIMAFGGGAFVLADPFLRVLHMDHIREFQGLGTHLAGLSGLHALQSVSALPLVLLPAAALVVGRRVDRSPGHIRGGQGAVSVTERGGDGFQGGFQGALAAGMVLAGTAFLHLAVNSSMAATLSVAGWAPANPVLAGIAAHLAALTADGVALVLLFLWPRRAFSALGPDGLSKLAVVAVPAVSLLALSFWQVRWLGTASAALLALAVTAMALGGGEPGSGKGRRRNLWAWLLLAVLGPFPVSTASLPWRFSYSRAEEGPQVVARDAAHWLRALQGSETLVVAAPPVTTTWLIYFGGVRGLGTLYWENLEGLKATAAIWSAPGEDQFRDVLGRHGVTHLLVPSWERFLPPGLSSPMEGGLPVGPGGLGREGGPFLARVLSSDAPPDWLLLLPYDPPSVPPLRGITVRIYEVRAAPPEGSGPGGSLEGDGSARRPSEVHTALPEGRDRGGGGAV